MKEGFPTDVDIITHKLAAEMHLEYGEFLQMT